MVASEIGASPSLRFSSMTRKPIRLKFFRFFAQRFLDQQLERRFRRLELVALAFELLGAAQDIFHRVVLVVQIDAVLFAFVDDVAAPGEIGHQHALAVTDQLGIDMLVGLAVLEHAGNMQPALMGEGAVADVGLALVRIDVRQLVE